MTKDSQNYENRYSVSRSLDGKLFFKKLSGSPDPHTLIINAEYETIKSSLSNPMFKDFEFTREEQASPSSVISIFHKVNINS